MENKIYEVKLSDDATLEEVTAVVQLLTFTLESDIPMCAEFIDKWPSLCQEVKNEQAIMEAMQDTGELT